jgi:hypothetical protein
MLGHKTGLQVTNFTTGIRVLQNKPLRKRRTSRREDVVKGRQVNHAVKTNGGVEI